VAGTPDFDALYLAERERVLALCLHVTGRRADAEDALQEAFLAVHRGLGRFRAEASPSTWLHRIALRAALRVKARRRGGEPLDPELAGPGLEADLERRSEARRITEALARLPAGLRTVLALFAVEGFTHPEIAEVLGVPEGTVWSRLHAARKRLREELGRGREEDDRDRVGARPTGSAPPAPGRRRRA
jgi:RNA polymerase sigma-70 factor (ECF subfamily)